MKCILRWVSGLKDDVLLTSSHLVGLIIEKKFSKIIEKILENIKKFEVLKLCEMHFALGFGTQSRFFVDLISPGGPNHSKKKSLKNFGKIQKF